MHGSFSSSSSHHGLRVDDEHWALDNSSRPSSPFHILTPQDIVPTEMTRSRFLDIIVDHFLGENVIEVAEPSGLDCLQANDKINKRKQQEVRYEGDPSSALPLMYIANLYESLVSDVNARLASLIGSREKTIGVALEAAGGLYRKLTQKFRKKGKCSFRRRELATSHATRTMFPELVVHEEKRVCFVVINGLVIIERPTNMRMEDEEWFKRLTGRNEVAISSRDYKFYSPRHKYRRTPQPVFDIPGTSALTEDESSPLCSPTNEMQNQQQSSSKQHIERLESQPYLHFLDQAEHDTIQQNQHSSHFRTIHPCTTASHLSDNPQQHQSYLSQHLVCLQAGHTQYIVAVYKMQNQQQSSSKQHIEQIESQPYLHFLDQAEHDTIQQNQHSSHFRTIHPCTTASHLSDNPQQHQSYLSQHLVCLQAGHGHLGGRMNILPTSPAKFCDECGSPYLRATSKFCSECGTKRLGI